MPDFETGAAPLRVCVAGTDAASAAALALRLRNADALVEVINTDTDDWLSGAAHSDVLVLAVQTFTAVGGAMQRFAAPARAMGIRHVVVAVDQAGDPLSVDKVAAALRTFANRFELASAEIISLADEDALFDCLAVMASAVGTAPQAATGTLTQQFAAQIVCSGDAPLFPGREYAISMAGQESVATLTTIKYRLDAATLAREPVRRLEYGETGACTVATAAPLTVDDGPDHAAGRFVLRDRETGELRAAGTVDFALRRGTNIHLQQLAIDKKLRSAIKDQRPCILWFTGLSGSGKSTIANLVEAQLSMLGCHTYMLDGDNLRHGLNKDLGFTPSDRIENIRRVGEVARLFVDAGLIVLCSFISPFRTERETIRGLVSEGEFVEIHVNTPLSVCEKRDPKGLYAKSRAGQLPNFTGIDSPYEAPETPDLMLDTSTTDADALAEKVVELLRMRMHLPNR